MKIHQIVLKVRAAVIRWQLRRLEVLRRRTVAEFMLAVDYGRRSLQELHFGRNQYIVHRRMVLESKLRQVMKGIV